MSNLSDEVQNELHAKGLLPFVSEIRTSHQIESSPSTAAGVGKSSPQAEVELIVYENEKWHNILQEFGSVLNVHLNAVFDRAPLTDESGFKTINGALSDIKPLSKYRWKGEWSVVIEPGLTDQEGYEYASNWLHLRKASKPATKCMPTSTVRRRRWRRTMEYNTAATNRSTPFTLTITLKRARLLGSGLNSNSHVEVRLNGDALVYRTVSGPPDWNAVFTFGLTELDSDDQLQFAVCSKKSGFASSGGDQLRGVETMDLKYFKGFKDKGVHQHEMILTMPGSGGTKGGYLTISFELQETNLFSIVPQYSPAFEVLRRVIGNSLSPELKQTVAALDNDKADLLRILVENVITGKDILVESDIFDVVSEVEFVQGVSSSYVKFDGRFTEGRIYRQRTGTQVYNKLIRKDGRFRQRRYPHGKLCFSKLMLLPPTSLTVESYEFKQLLACILHREMDLDFLNDRYAWSFPECSSAYDLKYDQMCCYEQSRYKAKSSSAGYYDLTIVCTSDYTTGKSHSVGHVLRFNSLYEYLMTLKELSKIQHAHSRVVTNVHYSTTATHGVTTLDSVVTASSLSNSPGMESIESVIESLGSEIALPKVWQPVTFTIDGEQELLVLREAVQTFESLDSLQRSASEIDSSEQMLNVVLPFNQIEGVVVHNSYHMYPRHNLEIHLLSVSSCHLKHTHEHCSIDIDTIDGLNHCNSCYEPQKRVVFPKGNQPTSVVLQDTHNLLLPQSALQAPSLRPTSVSGTGGSAVSSNISKNKATEAAEEFIHLTFRSPANKQHGIREVNSQAVIPLSAIYSVSSLDMFESQLSFKNTIQHYELRLLVQSAEDLISVDHGGTSDPYFVVYFADANGAIVELAEAPTSDTAMRFLHKAEKVIGGAAAKNKSDVLYKSRVISKNLSPVWFEEVLIDSEKYNVPLRKAKFILIEVWDNNDMRSNVALGEVYIPLLSAKRVDSGTDWTAIEPRYGRVAMPLQLSKHMKKAKHGYAVVKTLGSLSAQLLRKELPPSASGDHDLISLNLTMQLKPISAIDFSWPARIINNAGTGHGKGLEADLFHVDLAYDSLRVYVRGDGTGPSVADDGRNEASSSLWSSSSDVTERMQMLQQCKEYDNSSADHQNRNDPLLRSVLKIPYNQIHRSDIAVINTEMVIITVLLDRIVSHNGQPTVRTVAIDLLVGPCPAADFNNVLHQRISLNAYRSQIQKFYQDGVDLMDLDAVAKGLQSDIFESEQQVLKMSERQGENRVLANNILDESASSIEAAQAAVGSDSAASFQGKSDVQLRSKMQRIKNHDANMLVNASSHAHQLDPEAEMARHGSVFGDSSRRWSALYWKTNMAARVLMTRKIFFQVYHWFLLDFSYSEKADSIFSKETVFNDDYVHLLVRQARARLKTGDENDFRAAEGNDSDDEVGNSVIAESVDEIDTNSLKSRIEDVMKELDSSLRMLQFFAYRHELERDKCLQLANSLVYKHYLLLVAHLTEIFWDDVSNPQLVQLESDAPPDDDGGEHVEAGLQRKGTAHWRNSLFVGYHVVKFFDDVNKSIQASTANARQQRVQQQQQQQQTGKEKDAKKQLNPVKKRDLIAFIISKDNLFEEYLCANLFASGWKFSTSPSLAKCLNFDALIKKFAVLLGKNILKWNSQALRVLMCRSSKPSLAADVPTDVGVAVACKDANISSIPLPWDINTLSDHQHDIQLYISHIPETIQIQLNVQIELKRIPLKTTKENLSMSSIWRILSINKQIAASVAKAYVALALEYEFHLVNLLGGDDPAERSASTARKAGGKIRNLISNIAGTLSGGVVGAVASAGGTSVSSSSGNAVRRGSAAHGDSTDEVLCFIMSIINDCARIRRRHIPSCISKFTDDYVEVDEAMQHPAAVGSPTLSDVNARSGEELDTDVPLPSLSLLGAISDIERTFDNAKNAVETMEETSMNYLSSQILFHSELRDYFLEGFDTHLQVRSEEAAVREGRFSSLPIVLHRHQSVASAAESGAIAGAAGTTTASNDAAANGDEGGDSVRTSPVAVINATLDAFYTFAGDHLGPDEFHSVVYSCLKKYVVRYLIFVRDLQFRVRHARGKGKHHHDIGDSKAHKEALGGNDLDNKYFSSEQMIGIQEDLKMILQSYEIRDERVAEILRFFNIAIVDVLSGMLSEPEDISRLLQMQFHVSPPPFPSDCQHALTAVYERSLEDYIGFNASFTDMTEQEMRAGIFKTYTIDFSEFTVINLDDYRVIVVRVTFDGNTHQTTILPSHQVGLSTLRWKDRITFTNVQGYSSKNAVVEIVEIRPLKLRRELVLARVNIEFSALSRFLVPEPIEQLHIAHSSDPATSLRTKANERADSRGSIADHDNIGRERSAGRGSRSISSTVQSGHVGWYVMDDVRLEPGNASPMRIIRTKLKRSIVAGITATAVVATGAGLTTIPVANSSGNGNSSSSSSSSSSGVEAQHRTDRRSDLESADENYITKNSYIAVLSSDRPRENVPNTQIKFRIRIFHES